MRQCIDYSIATTGKGILGIHMWDIPLSSIVTRRNLIVRTLPNLALLTQVILVHYWPYSHQNLVNLHFTVLHPVNGWFNQNDYILDLYGNFPRPELDETVLHHRSCSDHLILWVNFYYRLCIFFPHRRWNMAGACVLTSQPASGGLEFSYGQCGVGTWYLPIVSRWFSLPSPILVLYNGMIGNEHNFCSSKRLEPFISLDSLWYTFTDPPIYQCSAIDCS